MALGLCHRRGGNFSGRVAQLPSLSPTILKFSLALGYIYYIGHLKLMVSMWNRLSLLIKLWYM